MIKRIMVVGGGTGGHLFPGIAVVEELRRRNPQVEVLFVGTQRGIEARAWQQRRHTAWRDQALAERNLPA